MRRVLVRKCNDIPFISFFHIPHSCCPRPYSSFHSNNTVKGKVGENSDVVHQGMFEVGRIGDAKLIYPEMISVGLMPNLFTQGNFLSPHTALFDGYFTLEQCYQRKKDPARYDRVSQMTTAMKEMAGKGFSFDATKAVLLVNVIRENPFFLDMMVETSRMELIVAAEGIEKEISALESEDKKLVAEMKRIAKTNKTAPKVLVHQVLMLRHQIAKLHGIQGQMRGVATQMQQMDLAKLAMVVQNFPRQSAQRDMTSEMISDAIDEAEEEAEDMTNQQMNHTKQEKVMQDFPDMMTKMISEAKYDLIDNDEAEEETEDMTNQRMDPTKQVKVMQDFPDVMTKMISEAKYDLIDNNDEAEEETEDMTNQVLDEIGVDVASSQLSAAPKGKIAGKRTEEYLSSSDIDELKKILDRCI